MPRTNNIVQHEAQLREAITTEEVRAKRWDQSYGARLAGPDAYKVRHVWDPQSLSKEAKLFASRGRSEYSLRQRPTSIVQGERYEWANPSYAHSSSICRSQLVQQRRLEHANNTDVQRAGGLALSIDRPVFGPNERFNTHNSAGVIGQAAPFVPPERPQYARTTWLQSSAIECRNDATQFMYAPRTTGGLQRAAETRPW